MKSIEQKSRKHNFAKGLAIGIPIGMPVGLAIGNLALGPAIGLLIGMVLGFVFDSLEDNDRINQETETGRNKIMIYLLIFGIVVFLKVLIYWLTRHSTGIA